LRRAARQEDVVARYGGDEFVVCLVGSDAAGAIRFADRVRADLSLRQHAAGGETRMPIRLSVGVASYPGDAEQANDLVGIADVRLYESKLQGGDLVTAGNRAAHDPATHEGIMDVLRGLVTAVDNKDRYTRKHSEHVTVHSLAIGQALGLADDRLRTIRVAAMLHDVGKIGVPDRLLRKPGPLDESELAVVRQHVELGEMIIRDVPNIAEVLQAVGAHHERIDGKGYPRGLSGDEIPLLGRILAVADAYSAMTTDRPYRRALGPRAGRNELLRVAGTQLDRDLVLVFVRKLDAELSAGPELAVGEDAGGAGGPTITAA
jgi:HD-GYP domain-containing protein (c-di-GMP phosphodiesterase class II)